MKTSFLLFLTIFLTTWFVGLAFADTESGVWHTNIGNIDVYCIQDAAGEMNSGVLLADDKTALERLAPTGKTPSSFSVFVVKKGTDTVLIDTGRGGQLIERLQSVGIKPEDVKYVLLTHSHGDHVGGLVKDGKKVFPNATLWLDGRESAFWKSGRSKEQYEQCRKLYGEPKFLTPDEKTGVVFPEMVAVDLAGHTPGHTGFLISSGAKKLLLVGDLLHNGAVQFARPDISIQYDNDPKAAAEMRRKTLQRAVDEKLLFGAVHLPFPSVGFITADGDGFRFMPAQ